MTEAKAFAPFTSSTFRWFFTGRSVSMLGSSMAPIALAFAVLDLTGSASDLGLVLAARTIPQVLLILIGGVVADRFSRSTVLTVSHLGAAASQGTVAILLLTGQPSVLTLIVLEAANGAISAFTFPAMQGVMPLVSPRDALQQANALMSFARSGSHMVGPSVAALLVVTVGSGWAIAADAASYLLAAFCMARLKLGAVPAAEGATMLKDLKVGWSEFRSRTWLWVVVLGFSMLNLIMAAVISTLGPAIAKATVGETAWGLFVSVQAVGFFVASMLLLKVRLRFPLRAGMLGCLFMAGPMLLLGIDPSVLPLVALGFLGGAGLEMFEIGWATAMQEQIPTETLSRVAAYDALGSIVVVPIGQILAGPLASWLGAQRVTLIGGVLFIVIVLLVLTSSSVRNLRRTEPQPTAESY